MGYTIAHASDAFAAHTGAIQQMGILEVGPRYYLRQQSIMNTLNPTTQILKLIRDSECLAFRELSTSIY